MLARLAFLVAATLNSTAALAVEARHFTVTPTITAAAYAQGDVMGALTKLEAILPESSGAIHLRTVNVVDKSQTKDAFDVHLFSTSVTVAADNAAHSVSDAEMLASFVGKVAVAAADFADTAANSYATKTPDLLVRGQSGKDLWLLLVCTDAGGCDYASTTDLSFRLTYYE